MINKAIKFAVAAHAGATRKGSDVPFILHPLEAAAIVARLSNDQNLMIAAILMKLKVGYKILYTTKIKGKYKVFALDFANYRLLIRASEVCSIFNRFSRQTIVNNITALNG